MSPAAPSHQQSFGPAIRQDRTEAILDHWRLDPTILANELPRVANRQSLHVALDTLLAAVATHPETPDPYVGVIEYAVLRGRIADAKLVLRTIERQLQINASWLHPGTYRILQWLVEPLELAGLAELGTALLEAPSPLRRAFLPCILQELAATEHAATLAAQWLRQYPDEMEAWWSAVALALERNDCEQIKALSAHLQTPQTVWQWRVAFLLVPALPEPVRWSYLADLLDLVHRHRQALDRIATTLEHLRATPQPEALVAASLVAHRIGLPIDTRQLIALPEPTTPVARALLAALATVHLDPRDVSPAIRSCLRTLLDALQDRDATARTVTRLVPALQPLTVISFALLVSDTELTTRALECLERPEFTVHDLGELAARLHDQGQTDQAISLLRHAARRARERHDRAQLVRLLRQLARLDPFDDRTLDFVVAHDTRSGRYAEALDTLLAAAHRANALGHQERLVTLLERAAGLAELADDRGRLAVIADLLATSDPDNPDRHVYAATAAVRAGQIERARTYLWTALRAALRQRRPLDALSIAEQLVALAPEDEAARAQFAELEALRHRLRQLDRLESSTDGDRSS